MLRIALCDDDVEFLNRFEVLLKKYIKPFNDDYEISKFTNGRSLLAIHNQAKFDVVFLDIDMPADSGLNVAMEFRESDSLLYIIFVTNHTKYVYESFNVQPFNYIVKSEKKSFENKLSSVIALLFNHMRQNQTIVLEDNRYGCVSVSFRDIKYIESKQHYCIFHIWHNKTEKSSYRIRKNISDLEQDLEYYNFVRIHKKYIVNLSYLISIDKNNRVVNFKDGTGLNMGPLYKQRTEEKFYNYLRKN